ncbi:helix-turn-helix domain-containing protein [Streptomyces sp. NPDC090741]|uniref:helix-turn-helix domain-containing protein n=1 Tax=Streptomyces sp. NPDC090741 TaxID=3365967 RepID=UPI00381D3BE6
MTSTDQNPTHHTTPETGAEPTRARRLPRGPERDQLVADLKEKYDGGASIRELADETGRSYGGVHRLLVEGKAALRGRGGAHRAPGAGQHN